MVTSGDSGNCCEALLLTGLLAGDPWGGEEEGEGTGEILARPPGLFCFLAFTWLAAETA